MNKLDNYTRFFGGHCQFLDMIEEVKFFNSEIEHLIELEKENFVNVEVDYINNETLSTKKYHFDNTLVRNLRESVIINLVRIIEKELQILSNELHTALSLSIKYSDLKGTVLEQFKLYSIKIACLNFDFNSIEWLMINEIVELRNCIVHYDAWIEDFYGRTFNRVNSINNLSKRVKSIKIDERGFVELGEGSSNECIDITEKFFYNIYKSLLERFPKV